jgi:hypothetical protein
MFLVHIQYLLPQDFPLARVKTITFLFVLLSASSAARAAEFVGEPACKFGWPNFGAEEAVSWNGPCKDGYAAGTGVLERKRKGALIDSTFARYEVTMAQGQIIGEGTINYQNGDKYTGNIRDGRREGNGYTAYANGNQFEGDYKNDRPNGNGILLRRDREEYVGGWKDGRFDGFGTIKFALGGSYEGAWKAGKFDGKGVLTYAGSGHRLEAEFEDGRVRGKPAPAQLPEKRFSIRGDRPIGSNIASEDVTGFVPFDKSYAELTPDQQAAVKKPYRALEEGDEPPYPLHGLKPIYDWLKKAQNKVLIRGDLRLDVLVGKDGNALSVTAIGSPSPEITKFATLVVMKEKYKPAVCRGTPCDMIFPFNMQFTMER